MLLLVALVLGGSVAHEEPEAHVARLELNHVYDAEGRLGLVQVIGWDFYYGATGSPGTPRGEASTKEVTIIETIYLAGPMRGRPYYGRDAFVEAAAALRERGYRVISPWELDREAGWDWSKLPANHDWRSVPTGFSMADAVVRNVRCIGDCDILVLLPDWGGSQGAWVERSIARWMGKRIVAYRDGWLYEG